MQRAASDPRPRVVLSHWLPPSAIFGAAVLAMFSAALLAAENPVARAVCVGILVFATVLVLLLLADQVLVLDRRGFHTLLHRRTPWTEVAHIRVREVPNWGRSTYALVADTLPDAEGQVRNLTLQGFGRPGRPARLIELRTLMESFTAAYGGISSPVSPVDAATELDDDQRV